MTTSGSADFSVSGGDIVRAAYRAVYNVSSEYTLEAAELADGLQALNILVKNLMGPPNFLAKGIKTWQREDASITLAAKIEYSLKPSGGDVDINIPVKILNANYKVTATGVESPLTEISTEQYFQIANKAALVSPTMFSYERTLSDMKFRLNGIPNATVVAAGDTIEISYLTPLEDFDVSTNDPYFPQEWFRALKWSLVQEMSPEAGKAISQDVAALALQSTESANSFKAETSNMFFEPNNPNNW